MPDRCDRRCSTVTPSSISGRSPPRTERAGVESSSTPSSIRLTTASAVKPFAPLASPKRVSTAFGISKPRCARPYALASSTRSSWSIRTTPENPVPDARASSSPPRSDMRQTLARACLRPRAAHHGRAGHRRQLRRRVRGREARRRLPPRLRQRDPGAGSRSPIPAGRRSGPCSSTRSTRRGRRVAQPHLAPGAPRSELEPGERVDAGRVRLDAPHVAERDLGPLGPEQRAHAVAEAGYVGGRDRAPDGERDRLRGARPPSRFRRLRRRKFIGRGGDEFRTGAGSNL